MSPLDVMHRQAATLFRHDAGRLLATNEPGDHPTPRLFIGRTAEGNLWRFRHDLPSALVRVLDAILAAEPLADDLRQPLRCEQSLRDALAAHAPIASTYTGPAWWCPEGIVAPHAVATTPLADGAALARHFPSLAREIAERQPCAAVLDGADAVAVCFCARRSAVAAEAGVETLAVYRRRGYAAAVVAAWAAGVREQRLLPLYSTSWDNAASQGVARSLGLVLYGVDNSFT